MEFLVEEYDDNKKDQIIEMICNIQQNEFGINIRKDDQPDLLNITNYYIKGKGNFWFSILDNEVIGTIGLIDIGNNQAAIRKMFVKKEYRGKVNGIANMLLNTLLKWAKSKGITNLYLGTTEKFIAAQHFYEKNGFKRIEENKLPKNFPIMKVDKVFYEYFV